MSSDDIFWERLLEMPDIEAEQELVARRAIVIRENAELSAWAAGRFNKEGVGAQINQNNLQLTLLNDHLKMIRKRMDRCSWKNAVLECLGQDAFDICQHWIRQNELQ